MTNVNGTATAYAYNKANLVTSVVNTSGETVLSSHTYSYYLDGNIKTEVMGNETRTYEYDGLGRLTREVSTGTSDAYDISYTYDARSNRATKTEGTYTTAYVYDANNRLTSETVTSSALPGGVVTLYSYDGNGNTTMATKSGTIAYSYTYSLFGTQESYTADTIVYTDYTYRPDGLRHSIGNTVHLWDGANIVADVDNNDLTVYFRGINLIYAENDGEQTYYHFNAHGDVVALTNANGTKTKSYSYDAFGEEYDISALDENPFRYCGEYYDTVSGTIYLRARYYDSSLGRFTQQDGWEFVKQNIPSSLNLYIYCWNDPTRFHDFSGNFPVETILDIASLGFSVVSFVANPTISNLADVAWDAVSVIAPYVPGSYVKRGVKLLAVASDKLANITKLINKTNNMGERLKIILANREYITGEYKDVKKILSKLGANLTTLGYEVHHLVEKRFADTLGIKNKDKILSIILDNETHDRITSELRKIIGYTRDTSMRNRSQSVQEIWEALVKVYEQHGLQNYLPLLKDYLIQYADNVGKITDWKGY